MPDPHDDDDHSQKHPETATNTTTPPSATSSQKPHQQQQQQQQPPIDLIVPDGAGKLFYQPSDDFVLCPPHLMPLKSVTLEKLEQMQRSAQLQLKETRARTAAAAAADDFN